jgi:DNA polymerase III gamma/tau subunit
MRVIVLDESHRLSGAALEALLKPLEEPAEQTLWILATTETNSLKDTLKNRCSKIFIRPAPADVLGKYLTKLSIDYVEDIPKKDLLKLNTEIAQMTGGYIRESLTILDSVIKTIQAGEYESTDQILEQVRSQLLANVEKDAYSCRT